MIKIKDIEEAYKRHANQKREIPPPAVWNRIEASLDTAQPKRRAVWLWRSAGAAAVFVGLVSLGLFFFNQSAHKDATSFSVQSTQPTTKNKEEARIYKDLSSTHANAPDPANENIEKVISEEINTSITEHNQRLTEEPINQIKTAELINPQHQQSSRNAELASEPDIPYLTYETDKPIFSSKKVEIKKLFANQSINDRKENYNVNSSPFDQQEALSAKSHKRKLQIGGAVSPVYSYRQTSGESNLSATASMTGNYSEKALNSTGGGINVNVEMGKNWSIESGVLYARLGQEVHSDIQSSRVYAMNTDKESYGNVSLKTMSLDNSLGEIKQAPPTGPSPQEVERTFASSPNIMLVDIRKDENITRGQLEQYIDYIEIPFTFRYYLINASTKLSLAGGVSTNWLVANNAYIYESGNRQKIGETNGLSTMNFSTHAGIAFSIPVYGPLSFRIEPRINYFINEINKQYPVKYKPYSLGIYSGIQYTIGE